MQNNTEKQRQFIFNAQSVDHGDIKLATDALHATVKRSSCNCNTAQQLETRLFARRLDSVQAEIPTNTADYSSAVASANRLSQAGLAAASEGTSQLPTLSLTAPTHNIHSTHLSHAYFNFCSML